LLKDGTKVILRAICPEDEPAEYEMLTSLSEGTLRTRLFSSLKNIGHEWLVLSCNIDYDRQMAIVAETRQDTESKMIGVGRLIIDHDRTFGEITVLVRDNFQGRGLGSKLVDMLIGIAREKGLDHVRSELLTENESMMHIFRRLGFAIRWLPGDTSEAVLKLK
jgi:acetyltransferase